MLEGHVTNTLGVITHPSVFTRDSEYIALVMVALHDLHIGQKKKEVVNAYVKAPNKEFGIMLVSLPK